ncbi:NUDIX hydrolase [Kiloniella sp. b19]|uniref:NUDIX hydrolase n=1 Tax=Kiloniella sp. GXU_MW_B19 TaxID=3141326 RepID=UPI0031CFA7FD
MADRFAQAAGLADTGLSGSELSNAGRPEEGQPDRKVSDGEGGGSCFLAIPHAGRFAIRSERDRSNAVRLSRLLEERGLEAFASDPAQDHITGSAFVVNPARTRLLMTHHAKLDRWLQLGGHSDGDCNPLVVALREAREESGLSEIRVISADVFDLDIHEIPARKEDPAHFHFDIRYLLEADDSQPLGLTHESRDLKWVPLDELERYSNAPSVLVIRDKLTAFLEEAGV